MLTAAHMTEGVIASQIHINGKEFTVLKTVRPIDFMYGEKLGGDIAICFLDKDMGLDFYPNLYEKNDEIGRVVSMAGFGVHGTFLTGGVLNDDKKRGGCNVVDSIVEDMLIVSPSRTNRNELEFCITPGDSGGGVFLDNKVVAISVCVFHGKKGEAVGKYGHEAALTRISHHKRWIDEEISMHESGFHGNEFIWPPVEQKR